MKFSHLALTLAAAQSISAHTVFTTLSINGVSQGDGTCVRMRKDPGTATDPVIDLTSEDMVCGFDGTQPVERTCSAPQGSKLSFEFRQTPDGSEPGVYDESHKGPCAVYMKASMSSAADPGTGDGWFKIYEHGYDTQTRQWCSDKIIQENGLHDVPIPSDLKGGDYLVRTELLALQEADKSPPQPQFYIGCAQLHLESTGASSPSPQNAVAIPGYVNLETPAVIFNIYEMPASQYQTPGPPIFHADVMPGSIPTYSSASSPSNLPPNSVATNGNWYAEKLQSYSTEEGCWNATESCYGQVATCYNKAEPTGSEGCKAWEQKCQVLKDNCRAGNYNGPPTGMKRDLDPPARLSRVMRTRTIARRSWL